MQKGGIPLFYPEKKERFKKHIILLEVIIMGAILFFSVLVLLFLFALWLIYLGVKGAYSIYEDKIGHEKKEMKEEIESLKRRLEEIEKKLNL